MRRVLTRQSITWRRDSGPASATARKTDFRTRYGPWALVTGAARGIGRAFAESLSSRGLDLLLVDRRADELLSLADHLKGGERQVITLRCDLAADSFFSQIQPLVDAHDIGLLVSNAAHIPVGPFLDAALPTQLESLATNCRAALVLCHELGTRMRARGSGGIVLVSSLSARQGTPLVATYAATKAFNVILAESLWAELHPYGIDALAVLPGVTDTEGFRDSAPDRSSSAARLRMSPQVVVAEALDALGRGPVVIPGRLNRLSAALLGRLLPRRMAIRLLQWSLGGLYPRFSTRK